VISRAYVALCPPVGRCICKVGDKLTASCDKPVFVRIGKRNQPSDPPRWLTKGRTVKVGCQQHTEIRSAPGS
jgi:hypothetical protein